MLHIDLRKSNWPEYRQIRSNSPRNIIIAAPTGLEYFVYRLPKLDVTANAAVPKITRSSSMKKRTYNRM
jgi:hypothetical protein